MNASITLKERITDQQLEDVIRDFFGQNAAVTARKAGAIFFVLAYMRLSREYIETVFLNNKIAVNTEATDSTTCAYFRMLAEKLQQTWPSQIEEG